MRNRPDNWSTKRLTKSTWTSLLNRFGTNIHFQVNKVYFKDVLVTAATTVQLHTIDDLYYVIVSHLLWMLFFMRISHQVVSNHCIGAYSMFFPTTLDSGINVGVRLSILGIFSSGYVLIKGGTFINLFIFHLLNIYFYFVSFSYV